MRINIMSPDYTTVSAGIRVLHKLCHILRTLKYDAFITSSGKNPEWNELQTIGADFEDIAIYPEVIRGNPLTSRKVVRYVLNHPGLLGGEKYYEESEMIWYFKQDLKESAQKANDKDIVDDSRLLYINVIEPELFYTPDKSEKKFESMYIGKYQIKDNYLPMAGSKKVKFITRQYPGNRKMTAELLRGSDTLWTLDNYTAMIDEAIYCGCRVMVWSDKDNDWIEEKRELKPLNQLEKDTIESVKIFIERVLQHYAD